MPNMPQSTIIVCDTCRWQAETRRRESDGRTGGEILAEQIEQRADREPRVTVRRHSCLAGCQRHCNAVVTAAGKYAYYLTGFAPEAESAEAIVRYAALHADSDDGRVPMRQWPEGVRGHFMGRVPPTEATEPTEPAG